MTNDKENYIGKQYVENKEANEIFSFLEGQMRNCSAQCIGMCRKVTYSSCASSWATIFALRDNEYRIWLLITILLCILFFMIDIIYNFSMEQFSRKLHYKFEHGNFETEDVDKRWNVVSDFAGKWLQITKLVIIAIMVIILAYYYFLAYKMS